MNIQNKCKFLFFFQTGIIFYPEKFVLSAIIYPKMCLFFLTPSVYNCKFVAFTNSQTETFIISVVLKLSHEAVDIKILL